MRWEGLLPVVFLLYRPIRFVLAVFGAEQSGIYKSSSPLRRESPNIAREGCFLVEVPEAGDVNAILLQDRRDIASLQLRFGLDLKSGALSFYSEFKILEALLFDLIVDPIKRVSRDGECNLSRDI